MLNYIDEVLRITNKTGTNNGNYYYLHDHLYSPAVLVEDNGTVVERYEYDAYGASRVLEPNFAPDPDGLSDYANSYLFTGRRLDILDANSLKIQYNRNRYYDPQTGRWLTHDPLKYVDAMNLYEYLASSPVFGRDPFGEEKEFSEFHRAAVDALRSIYYNLRNYAFFTDTGLKRLLTRLYRELYLYDTDKVVAIDDWREDERWSRLTGKIWLNDPPGPASVFHEVLHMYLNRVDRRLFHSVCGERLYNHDGLLEGRCDWERQEEGAVTAASAIMLSTCQGTLSAVEDEVKRERCPRRYMLQRKWRSLWKVHQKGIGFGAQTLGESFQLEEVDFMRVEKSLDFKIRCSSLADLFNSMLRKRNFHCYLRCTTGPTESGAADQDIYLDETSKIRYDVFK